LVLKLKKQQKICETNLLFFVMKYWYIKSKRFHSGHHKYLSHY